MCFVRRYPLCEEEAQTLLQSFLNYMERRAVCDTDSGCVLHPSFLLRTCGARALEWTRCAANQVMPAALADMDVENENHGKAETDSDDEDDDDDYDYESSTQEDPPVRVLLLAFMFMFQGYGCMVVRPRLSPISVISPAGYRPR